MEQITVSCLDDACWYCNNANICVWLLTKILAWHLANGDGLIMICSSVCYTIPLSQEREYWWDTASRIAALTFCNFRRKLVYWCLIYTDNNKSSPCICVSVWLYIDMVGYVRTYVRMCAGLYVYVFLDGWLCFCLYAAEPSSTSKVTITESISILSFSHLATHLTQGQCNSRTKEMKSPMKSHECLCGPWEMDKLFYKCICVTHFIRWYLKTFNVRGPN